MNWIRRSTKKISLAVLLIVLSLAILSGQEPFGNWDYPIKLGTPEWRKLKTDKEKYKACQIPDETLKSLTTGRLVELCIEYPLFHRVLLYDNLKEGYDHLKANFNGFRELFFRENLDIEMLKIYKGLPVNEDIPLYTEKKKREIVARAWRIELIMSSEIMENESAYDFAGEFVIESYRVYNIKKNNPDIFSSFSYQLPLCILAKSLSVSSKNELEALRSRNHELDVFLDTYRLPSQELEMEIINLADNWLANHK